MSALLTFILRHKNCLLYRYQSTLPGSLIRDLKVRTLLVSSCIPTVCLDVISLSATGRRQESMQAEITVRRVRAQEWEWLRVIRLRALADTPMAFGSTLANEQRQPDEFWHSRAAGGAADHDRATFIAERDGVWVGIGTCVLEEGGAGTRPAWIFGMWVEPAVRRQGTAQALLRGLAAWAQERGA